VHGTNAIMVGSLLCYVFCFFCSLLKKHRLLFIPIRFFVWARLWDTFPL